MGGEGKGEQGDDEENGNGGGLGEEGTGAWRMGEEKNSN